MNQIGDIMELMEALEGINSELAPLLASKKEVEAELKALVLARGEKVTHGKCTATIRAAYNRVSWNSKGLLGYAVAYPEVNDFKKVSTVKAAVVVKFSK